MYWNNPYPSLVLPSLLPWIISAIAFILVYTHFLCVLIISRIWGLEYRGFGTEETANLLIIVWLMELKKLANTCTMVQCLADRRCGFENLSSWDWIVVVTLAQYVPSLIFGMLNELATQSFKLRQFWRHWNSCSLFNVVATCPFSLAFNTRCYSAWHLSLIEYETCVVVDFSAMHAQLDFFYSRL